MSRHLPPYMPPLPPPVSSSVSLLPLLLLFNFLYISFSISHASPPTSPILLLYLRHLLHFSYSISPTYPPLCPTSTLSPLPLPPSLVSPSSSIFCTPPFCYLPHLSASISLTSSISCISPCSISPTTSPVSPQPLVSPVSPVSPLPLLLYYPKVKSAPPSVCFLLLFPFLAPLLFVSGLLLLLLCHTSLDLHSYVQMRS